MSASRIVIAGSGPVGLMTAALLANDSRMDGVELRILDAAPAFRWSEAQFDIRVYALSRASQAMFEHLGLWEAVRRRVSPYRAMRVWQGDDPDGVASVHFEAALIGEPDLGHIVEDSLLRDVLLGYLQARRVRVDFDTAIAAVAPGARRISITTGAGEDLRADLLVGADGARSRVRELAGIAAAGRAYGQQGLVVHVRSALPHRETAWQRFGDDGPLALLPLADGRSSVVWSVTDPAAQRLESLADPDFEAELERGSGGVLGRLTLASQRAAFPLGLSHALRYAGQSIVLAGDAAHAVHPLAGQGMNLGLLDAAALAETVARAHAAGEYFGDRYVLDRYARARRAHNVRMQLAFDAIDRLFRAAGPASTLRAAGMLATDSLPFVKRALMEQALGLGQARLLRAG